MTDPSDGSEDAISTVDSDGVDSAREVLLDESRTTLEAQLGQIDKIDDAAVRTVRIALVVVGILAGSSRFVTFPELGLAGYVGSFCLFLAVIGSVTVYGTSRVFVGSAPDAIAVRYRESPTVDAAYLEMLTEYEAGLSDNRRTLAANGVILAASRALLVSSVLLLFVAFVSGGTDVSPGTVLTASILMASPSVSDDVNSDSESDDRTVSQPVVVYTGPKSIADAKVAFGKWLEERRS